MNPKKYLTIENLHILGKTFPFFCQVIELPQDFSDVFPVNQFRIMLKQLSEFLKSVTKILLIVNDAARSTQTEIILQQILPLLESKNVRIIVATGAHKEPNGNDLVQIFGSLLPQILPHLIFHDAYSDEHIQIGKTSFNNQICVHKIVAEVDGIITINSVEPHYFAGFTGGRKSIIPGIASIKTIEFNHSLAMNEKANNLILKNNPVHEDMEEGSLFLPASVFSIQLVQNTRNEIRHIYSGDLKESFYNAVEKAKQMYVVSVKKQADIVIAEIDAPLDRTFYQAHKALENCKNLLKKGGIFILVAACNEGIGNAKFVQLLNEFTNLTDVLETCEKKYFLGIHKTYRIASFLLHSKLWLISSIEGQIINQSNFRNESNLDLVLNEAIADKGCNALVYHVKQAGVMAPIVFCQ
jgi:nickel-dependent lactate racemase